MDQRDGPDHDLVHGKEESMCTLSDGVRALELALAAKRAAEKKEMVRMR